jgi:hypothetical protein
VEEILRIMDTKIDIREDKEIRKGYGKKKGNDTNKTMKRLKRSRNGL